jgi:MFS family permease
MSLGPAVGGHLADIAGAQTVFLAAGSFLFLDLGVLLWLLPARPHAPKAGDTHDDGPEPLGKLLRNRPLLGCWLVTLGACFGLGMFTSFMPLHAQNRGLEVSQIGMVFLAQGLLNGASRIPFGRLSDMVSRRSTLVALGICLYSAALVGCGLSSAFGQFVLAAGLVGASMGLAFTSVGALIAEVVPPPSRGSAMGGYNTCIYLGMMLSSGIMGRVSEAIGFAMGFYLTAIANMVFLGGFLLLIKSFAARSDVLPS